MVLIFARVLAFCHIAFVSGAFVAAGSSALAEQDAVPDKSNLVENGDFEFPRVNGYQNFGESSAGLSGWKIGKAVQLLQSGVLGDQRTSSQVLQLSSAGAEDGAVGTVEQSLGTVPGVVYRLSFELWSRDPRPGHWQRGLVQFGAEQFEFEVSADQFKAAKIVFITAPANARLTLLRLSAGGDAGRLVIDNVSVRAVPETVAAR